MSLLVRNPSRQLVRKRISYQAAVENFPKAHTIVDSDKYELFEHFI